jgi:aromatic ring-opening dioxygenase LigB subunit
MALKNTILLPHSPLLIPEIGRANYNFLTKTVAAYSQVAANLKDSQIETLVIISPHGLIQEKTFTLNVAPEMRINLRDFGFIQAKTFLVGDALLADQIKNSLKDEISLQLISETELDYGSAIPAYLLKKLNGDFKIIVLSPANDLSLEEHFDFGLKLQRVLKNSEKNIAVIASGDLSHRLKRKSPGGYSPKGVKFDNKLIEYLSEPESAKENLVKMDAKLIREASECGLKPIMILLGLVNGFNPEPKILAYQTDFGIGYLSLDFKI